MSSKSKDLFTHTLNTGKYEWYFEIKSKTMIRLPSGTKIKIYPSYKDERGRVMAITEVGDYIYVHLEDILEIKFH